MAQRPLIRTTAGFAVALSLVTGGLVAVPAHAVEVDPSAVEASATANAAAGSSAMTQEVSAEGTTAEVDGGGAEISTDPTQGVMVTDSTGTVVSLGVPGDRADGTVVAGNVVYPDVATDASVVARAVQDGAQALIVIDGPEAPSRFEFPVQVDGEDAVLRTPGDSSIEVLDAESDGIIATIDPPWATDASGRRVPTHYEVRGSSIVQVVDHAGARYPVTADPKVSLGWSIYVRYNKSEVKDFKSKAPYIGAAAMIGRICTLLPIHGALKAVCAASVAIAWGAISETFSKAAKENKCVEIKFSYSGDLDGWKRYKC